MRVSLFINYFYTTFVELLSCPADLLPTPELALIPSVRPLTSD